MAFYLVTGGAGFIGSNVVAELVRQGEPLLVLDNFSTGKRENLLPFEGKIELTRATCAITKRCDRL
jgi:nucleoside-diphosphate-sugar epimerase